MRLLDQRLCLICMGIVAGTPQVQGPIGYPLSHHFTLQLVFTSQYFSLAFPWYRPLASLPFQVAGISDPHGIYN